ncbi:acyltransferase [Flavihumibacter sp. CACIAM 22H1]|uniref:acyltransferase family protein n=1 Tax=Flavihumibacter sp. CACIAM 22H1 TaxID=1812911 RepID=UPI0007A802A7|nr:acyltransferase [Flavihumibacter sp. CACIAM 22H1]KYP16091.1 MAG: hypothetical protein A1D16_18675 [Flavihumibacter sp. CACIAM 22H1]
MNESRLTGKTIPVLDGFRGLAILLVLCYHFEIIKSWGWMGVDLFFVLSGFLITRSLYPANGLSPALYPYYRNRILRIVPACFLSLLLIFIVVPLVWSGADSPAYQILRKNQWYYWTFQTDIWYALDGFPAMVLLLPLWSLGVEAKFYLVWPYVTAGIRTGRYGARWLYLGVLVVMAIIIRSYAQSWLPAFEQVYRYVFFLCRLDAFAIGAALYFVFSEGGRGVQNRWWGLIAAVIFLYFMGLFVSGNWNGHYSSNWIIYLGFTLIATGWASLVLHTLQSNDFCNRLFQAKWLAAMGKYSYGIYVFHYPIWILVHRIHLPASLLLIIACLATLLIGYLSYHLVEKPFLRLKQ